MFFHILLLNKCIQKLVHKDLKKCQTFGKWTRDGGAYNGTGIRGEYYVLGTSYSGSIIDNVYFPVDSVPETTPEYWQFIEFEGAYESWNVDSKYQEQIEYMKNSKMLFDTIDYNTSTCNSYNLVEYNMSANSIGLNKARLNTCATWKTMGVISTRRINNNGAVRTAIFAIRPMAASADVKSKVICPDEVTLQSDEDELQIKVSFGASAINLNDYASEKHIKEIFASLKVNGNEVGNRCRAKSSDITSDYIITIDREKYKSGDTINLEIYSYLYTEFSVDGLMQDRINKNITINIEEKNEVPVKNFDIGHLQKDDKGLYISPLAKTNNTVDKSCGILEGGNVLACKLELDGKFSNIDNINVKIDDREVEHDILKSNEKNMVISINIPKDVYSSIAAWSSLRDIKGNYFNVDFCDVGMRLNEPHRLVIEYMCCGKKCCIDSMIDTIDSYDLNINHNIQDLIINKEEAGSKIRLNEW